MTQKDRILRFRVDGDPVAKARPRFSTHNGQPVVYTPEATRAYEGLVALLCREAIKKYAGKWHTEGQFHLTVDAFFTRPKSRPQVWHHLAVMGAIRPTARPDWDNVGKIISDALNGHAWKDDSMVVSATVNKRYTDVGGEPYVWVQVEDITDERDRWIRKQRR